MSRLDDIKAKLATAKAAADAAKPSQEQLDEAAALAEIAAHDDTRRAHEATKRGLAMAEKLEAAEKLMGRSAIVEAIDLYKFFAKSPPPERMPNGGILIVRDVPPAALDLIHSEGEKSTMTTKALAHRVASESTIDPPESDTAERVRLGAFFDAYQDACSQVAAKARALGGARQEADRKSR